MPLFVIFRSFRLCAEKILLFDLQLFDALLRKRIDKPQDEEQHEEQHRRDHDRVVVHGGQRVLGEPFGLELAAVVAEQRVEVFDALNALAFKALVAFFIALLPVNSLVLR